MTRIIAGTARGRRLAVPPRGTRPTSDRVREALFSALAARIDFDEASVLDLYAGSGALGLEGLSRGASRVVLVDHDAKAAAVAQQNVRTVGLAGVTVRHGSVDAFLKDPLEPFDVVFLDPPYGLPHPVVDRNIACLSAGWLRPGSYVAVERSARTPGVAWSEAFKVAVTRDYGETRIEIAVWQDQKL